MIQGMSKSTTRKGKGPSRISTRTSRASSHDSDRDNDKEHRDALHRFVDVIRKEESQSSENVRRRSSSGRTFSRSETFHQSPMNAALLATLKTETSEDDAPKDSEELRSVPIGLQGSDILLETATSLHRQSRDFPEVQAPRPG